jgi:uncharacterized protein YjbI with pentapeptide repeats
MSGRRSWFRSDDLLSLHGHASSGVSIPSARRPCVQSGGRQIMVNESLNSVAFGAHAVTLVSVTRSDRPPAHADTDVSGEPGEVRYRVLSITAIWCAAGLIVLVGIGVAVWLLVAYGRGDEQARNQLEAIKTAGTIVVGTGGAAALLLAARRQRTAEIALKHQERVATATEADAAARRITELYTKAADQFGSDKAPVRLAGLYALERLAQDNETQRQTIVNLLCAYLRMPYQLPSEPPCDDADAQLGAAHHDRVQEREVRRTAQRLLTNNLWPGNPKNPALTYWGDLDLDLTGAILIDFSLADCTVGNATFRSAMFTGLADFRSATFTGDAQFESATFTDDARFQSATFTRPANFVSVTFTNTAYFEWTTFTGDAYFESATFTGDAYFESATFTRQASFDFASFIGHAHFESAIFTGRTKFESTTFTGHANFHSATFTDVPEELAQFRPSPDLHPDTGTWPER